ncbi:MAG: recombination mediator RecR [Elusimicrobia bacterium]|jgi:recombination protein RecR|nr:recombination mediator RecR [Elusimicrobiota bacterium]
MYNLPESVENLINALSMLPGIGPKTAQRLAFYILKSPVDEANFLSDSVISARESIRPCVICGNFTDKEECNICRSQERDREIICVVENPQDILAIESSGEYNGLFHVLMGALSPLDGINPEDLRIDELVGRVKKEEIKEVIIATDPNVEGEATAAYIKEILNKYPVKITHLAYGIPMGGNLEYADGVTLGKALEGRREF